MAEKLLTTRDAAAVLGVAPNTLEIWRSLGRYDLPFVRIGARAVRYRQTDLEAFIARGLCGAEGGQR